MAITLKNVGGTVELGSGILYFDPWDSDNFRTGEIHMGEPDDVTFTVEQGDVVERKTRTTVARSTIFTQTSSGTRSLSFTGLTVDDEALKLFISGEKETIAQTATPVTDEVIWSEGLEAERYFQLGQSSTNPVGVIGGSSVSITSFPSGIVAWAATTAYSVGDAVEKTVDDGTVWAVTVAGTSGGSEPTWPTTAIGDTVVSGTVTFKRVADAQETFTLDTDYQLETGTDGGLRIKWISPDTFPFALWANYTPTANSRTRLKTGENFSLVGTARFISAAANPVFGKNYVFNKVELVPEGDFGLVTDESTLKTIGFTATILSVTGTPDIVIDGVPS